ncbi:MAG: nuclear transport factor 2 family protein [Candidatus Binatia bacterium]
MADGRAETEKAFAEYKRLAECGDWARWAELFTEDAVYEEHWLGTFHGRPAIQAWIVDLMAQGRVTVWMEWQMFDDRRVCVYAWNNLPDPTGTGRRFTVPSSSLLEYAGDGKFSWEGDFYNGIEAERFIREWQDAGGSLSMNPDPGLRGVHDWAPRPPATPFPRVEIEQAFETYLARRTSAVRNHRWDEWTGQFTDKASYRNHRLGRVRGKAQIRNLPDDLLLAPPACGFRNKFHLIDGNRVSAVASLLFPDPAGTGSYSFDINTILHYAGNGEWSYAEDLYNPSEAEAARHRSGGKSVG